MTDIPVSTAPAVRAWLLAQVTAALTPDPLDKSAQLLVCLDSPGTFQPADIVAIGDVATTFGVNSLVGSGGSGWLEERYTVNVDIEIFRGGDSAQAVSDRAFLLGASVINCVRQDPSLGTNVLVGKPISSEFSGDETEDHSGRLGTLSIKIEAFQRI